MDVCWLTAIEAVKEEAVRTLDVFYSRYCNPSWARGLIPFRSQLIVVRTISWISELNRRS